MNSAASRADSQDKSAEPLSQSPEADFPPFPAMFRLEEAIMGTTALLILFGEELDRMRMNLDGGESQPLDSRWGQCSLGYTAEQQANELRRRFNAAFSDQRGGGK